MINSEIGSKNLNNKKVNYELKVDNQIYTDPEDISNVFNDYFINVVKETSECCLQNQDRTTSQDDVINFSISPFFRFQFVESIEISKIISSFKNKYSSGFDEVPVSVLKASKHHLSPVLAHLINSSFVSGTFPDKLKISKVIPIHKKDDTKTISNFRPVSLLSTISKVYEKVVYNQLAEYLESNNLFDNCQHGFRSGKSVNSAAVEFLESIIESVDNGECTVGIFMDLTKAFDSVKHSVLVQKLKLLGIKKKRTKLV